MRTEKVIKYKCLYCNGIFDEKPSQCPQCGAVEFDEQMVTVNNKKIETKNSSPEINKHIKRTIILVILSPLFVISFIFIIAFISIIFESSTNNYENKGYKESEYSYSAELLEKDELFLGKNANFNKSDYHNTIKITGSFNDLYNNVYKNIFSSQFNNFTYKLPCDIEVKHNDINLTITSFSFSYYNTLFDVDLKYSLSNPLTEDVSLYFVDENGNKVRLLIEKYYSDEFKDVKSFINDNKSFYKTFSLDGSLVKYDKFIINIGNSSYEYDLDYNNTTGSITYYGLEK